MFMFDKVPRNGKVNKLYPDETWTTENIGGKAILFVSSARKADGAKDPIVYDSDTMIARTLARETGEDVYLLPERNVGASNPDAFFIDGTMEFKHVHGNLNKVGKNAIKALGQSENVMLFTDKDFTITACLSKIKGSFDARLNTTNGGAFTMPSKSARLYIYTGGKLYKYTWGDIMG